jgi:hypothetical protein
MSPVLLEIPLKDMGTVDVSQFGDSSKIEIRRRTPGERGRGPIILVLNPHVPPGGSWDYWMEGDTLKIKIDLPLDKCGDSP